MYIIECPGKFFVPIRKGQFEILGMTATVDDITAVSRVTLVDTDSFDIKASTYDLRKGLIDVKGLPNQKGILEQMFPGPLKTMRGLSVIQSDNVVPGTIKVFLR